MEVTGMRGHDPQSRGLSVTVRLNTEKRGSFSEDKETRGSLGEDYKKKGSVSEDFSLKKKRGSFREALILEQNSI